MMTSRRVRQALLCVLLAVILVIAGAVSTRVPQPATEPVRQPILWVTPQDPRWGSFEWDGSGMAIADGSFGTQWYTEDSVNQDYSSWDTGGFNLFIYFKKFVPISRVVMTLSGNPIGVRIYKPRNEIFNIFPYDPNDWELVADVPDAQTITDVSFPQFTGNQLMVQIYRLPPSPDKPGVYRAGVSELVVYR